MTSYLFEESKLTTLSDWEEINSQLEERKLLARPLRIDDFDKGYMELLQQLTTVGSVSKTDYESTFAKMKALNSNNNDHYVIVVIEDIETEQLIATSTLFLELKFIHECGVRGRLEDVSVDSAYRGKKVGELLVRIIVSLASQQYNCYKITLDCTDELQKFYHKNNFCWTANQMTVKFE